MCNIIIIGSSGHSKVIIDTINLVGAHKIIGLVDSYRSVGEKSMGYSVLGKPTDICKIIRRYKIHGIHIAVGDNYSRMMILHEINIRLSKVVLISSIHPSAVIAKDVSIGAGSAIMAGVVINPGASVGCCSVLNTNSSLDHDSEMADYSSLAPNVAVGGNSTIGKCSAIGIGATITNGVSVGSHSVIGAGALVIRSVRSNFVAYGIPAKEIRVREIDEKYM